MFLRSILWHGLCQGWCRVQLLAEYLPGAKEQHFDMHPGFAEHLGDLAYLHIFGVTQPERLELIYGQALARQLPQLLPVFLLCEQLCRINFLHRLGHGSLCCRRRGALPVNPFAARDGE